MYNSFTGAREFRPIVSGCPISCGVSMLNDLRDFSIKLFRDFISYGHLDKDYTYIFSDNKEGNGKNLADAIRKYKLGKLTETPWAVNPNSENMIKVWVWRYNGRNVPKRAAK